MASSGTVADPIVEVRLKTGHNGVMLMGRMRIKSTAIVEAPDLSLKTIKSALFTAYDATPVAPGGPPVLFGSVTQAGSLQNSVRVRSFRGSLYKLSAPALGRQPELKAENQCG